MKKATSFFSLSLGVVFSSHLCCMCPLVSLSLLALKTFEFLRLRMRAQRACLAEQELVTKRLTNVDALSVRSDKGFAERADFLAKQISLA